MCALRVHQNHVLSILLRPVEGSALRSHEVWVSYQLLACISFVLQLVGVADLSSVLGEPPEHVCPLTFFWLVTFFTVRSGDLSRVSPKDDPNPKALHI